MPSSRQKPHVVPMQGLPQVVPLSDAGNRSSWYANMKGDGDGNGNGDDSGSACGTDGGGGDGEGGGGVKRCMKRDARALAILRRRRRADQV